MEGKGERKETEEGKKMGSETEENRKGREKVIKLQNVGEMGKEIK